MTAERGQYGQRDNHSSQGAAATSAAFRIKFNYDRGGVLSFPRSSLYKYLRVCICNSTYERGETKLSKRELTEL